MLISDAAGLDVTVENREAVAPWNATVQAFLAHGAATPLRLAETLDAAEGFALAHAAKGFFYVMLARRELIEGARLSHAAARAAASAAGATSRERAYVDALGVLLDGRMGEAAERMDRILADHPSDALAVKIGQSLRFMLGDAWGMRKSVEAVVEHFGEDHPHGGYVAGCHAFALEETGHYQAAETRGRAALDRAPDDAWGLHAVAHVYDMTARPDMGEAWLRDNTARWEHCNNFGFHVWWHLALFLIEKGETDAVLELYDTRVRAEKTDDFRDIANAASLLARLEMEGRAVGDRWEELGALSETRIDDASNVFGDLHRLMALHRTARDEAANRMIERLARDAALSEHDMHEVAGVAGCPVALGLACFRAGDYAGAFARLTAARSATRRVGGSHAQRDVFQRIAVEAGLRAGLLDQTEAYLSLRAGKRGCADAYTDRRLAEIADRRAGAAREAARPALRLD